MNDQALMRRAITLAEQGKRLAAPNPRVGCVIARSGAIVAEGFHSRDGGPHAEQQALAVLDGSCAGADVFVTLEPCAHVGRTPACAQLLAAAGPARVLVAVGDPDRRVAGEGIALLREAGIDVSTGLLAEEAAFINRGYIARQTMGRPWVRIKTAASLDGRIALPDGSSKWITSEHARRDVHELRACSCAIATGIGTALADDPQLTAREVGAERQPLRVLFDSRLQAHSRLRMLADGEAVVFTAAEGNIAGLPSDAQLVRLPDAAGKVDLLAALQWLAQSKLCNEVTFEAGGRLVGALLQAGLVDEAVCYSAPLFMGAGRPSAEFGPPSAIADCPRFELRSVEALGSDIKAVYVRPGEEA